MAFMDDREIAARPAMRAEAPARRLRLCFVAPNAFGALCGRPAEHSGGVERQTALWARWFAGRDHAVQLVTWDVGQQEGAQVEGVTVRKLCRREQGVPGLRMFHPRWTSLVGALARADADIYVCMPGDSLLGQMALWCRSRGRRLAYYLSSNRAADPALPNLVWREKRLYRIGVKGADLIMAQTRSQQSMLKEAFGADSVLVPMPCEEMSPPQQALSKLIPPAGASVLWVGRFSREKRLEWLLDLAEACPELRFDVAGAANDTDAYASGLSERAKALPNVILHGRVSETSTLARLYRNAALLCCTSSSEGFPNTFLEAWSHAVPIVTTFDPDGLTADLELGAVAADVPGLAAAVRGMLESTERYARCSMNAQRYYREYHQPDRALARVERHFFELPARR